MKAMTTGMLNAGYLRELRRDNGVATIIAVCVTMTGLLWMVFRFGGNEITALFVHWMYGLAGFTGAFWTLRTVYRARRREVELAASYQLAWLLIGLGLLVNGIAGISLVFLEIVGQTSLLWFASILSGLYYPLIFAGLFFMHDGKQFRISMVIDALITTFCLLGICWFLIIGPAYQHIGSEKSIEYLLELAMTFSCPLGAVLLVLAFALLIQRGIAPAVRLSFCLIGASLLAHIWAASAYAYTSGIIHSYQAGTPYIDTFWLISFLLLGLAMLYQYTGLASQADQERMQAQRSPQRSARPTLGYKRARVRGWRRIQNMLIYVPLVFVLGLMASGELLHDNWISDDLAALAAFIATLMAVRHFFATRENDALLQEREKRHQESEHLRYIVTQLTDIVELEQLRE
ncbi:MAG TPA: hypothetical protein VFB12_18460, partial [Ktedonobacteraceae bacterium]|nr:hypothetical protein [Ktedonobacteraceae bacterium]